MTNGERIKELAKKMTEAFGHLSEIALDFNQAAEDEDRGPDNNALGVIMFEDGSCFVAEFSPPVPWDSDPLSNGRVLQACKSLEELEAWLIQYMSPRSL